MKNPDFLEKVTELFFRYGAKTLTMDDIAKEFSVSKKTLYQSYSTKEEVLKAALEYWLDKSIEDVDERKKKFNDPISSFFYSDNLEDFMVENRNVFIAQMHKYYPDILREHYVITYNKLNSVIKDNILEGRTMGLYRDDFDEDLYTKFFLQLFFSADESPLFNEESKKRDVLCRSILDFYLNSIVTDKGKHLVYLLSFYQLPVLLSHSYLL